MAEFVVPVKRKVLLSSQEGEASYCRSILSSTTAVSGPLTQVVPEPICSAPLLICAVQPASAPSSARHRSKRLCQYGLFRSRFMEQTYASLSSLIEPNR